MWSKEKREQKRNYYRQQRINPTGNFTEYITRVYYNILKFTYKETKICLIDNINSKKVVEDMYKGIYVHPDHDAYNVMNNCIKELINMGYIHEEIVNNKKCIVVDRELDYLINNENENYLEKYGIKKKCNSINNLNCLLKHTGDLDKNDSESKIIDLYSCRKCNGKYVLRNGKYGYFYGCNHFPTCKSTRSIADFTYDILLKKGLAIYEFETECWKCHKHIKVISYFPIFDLCNIDSNIEKIKEMKVIRLSILDGIDKMLEEEYSHIKEVYSKKAGFSYTANTCEHCGALQGSTMALSNVFKKLYLAFKTTGVNQFIVKRIQIDENILSRQEWTDIIERIKI